MFPKVALEIRSGSRILHNMSAPPRMTITLQPFQDPGPSGTSLGGAVGTVLHHRLAAHVDLIQILRATFPYTGAFIGSRVTVKWRVAGLVQLSRQALGQPPAKINPLHRRNLETLHDELRENICALDVTGLDMPVCGIVRRAPIGETVNTEPEMDPVRALALAARVAGQIFVARRTPRVTHLTDSSDGFWIYSADAGPQPEEAS